jgi:hypothetical protein
LPGDDAGWLSGDWIALHRKSMTRRHSQTQVTEVTQHEMVSEPEPESCRKPHSVQRAFGAVDAGDYDLWCAVLDNEAASDVSPCESTRQGLSAGVRRTIHRSAAASASV